MTVLEHINGADHLTDRFGGWPSFHDAEVVRLVLDRHGANGPTVEMLVHTWLMTDKVDEQGHYVLENHTLVRFLFDKSRRSNWRGSTTRTSCSDSSFRRRRLRASERFE
jgi:hypothetical protein